MKPRFCDEFAFRHRLFQLVAACFAIACHAWKLNPHGAAAMPRPGRFRERNAAPSIRIPNDFRHAVFPNSVAPHPFQGNDATHAPSSLQREIVSSAMPLVRGPISPIAAITITIAPAMNANTPTVPNPLSTAAITNDEKIAEKRLHE